jgi:7,8-dihydro-6-hydroxymethylpterin-pyrophosphokinase
MKNKELTLPHPSILERDFVLRPLLDLNPKISHPSWSPKTAKSGLSGLREKFTEGEPETWVLPN